MNPTKLKNRQYFCGGTGMTAGLPFVANEGTAYIDTSDADLVEGHDTDKVFLTEGTRGGGKDRKFILDKVRPQVPKFLERFPAADFNIVCFSLGGASGSTTGPLVIHDLAKKGETVVAVVVGGTESTDVLKNDTDTLKTLEGIAAATGTPIPVVYIENSSGVSFNDINEDVADAINALLVLTSQKHRRLDVMDIENWIRFNRKHPQIAPQLCQLHIFTNRQEAALVQEPISIASLYTDPSKEVSFGTPFARTVGYANPEDPDLVAEQLHFVINTLGIEETVKGLEDLKLVSQRQQQNFRQRAAIIDPDDERTEDGFVV